MTSERPDDRRRRPIRADSDEPAAVGRDHGPAIRQRRALAERERDGAEGLDDALAQSDQAERLRVREDRSAIAGIARRHQRVADGQGHR